MQSLSPPSSQQQTPQRPQPPQPPLSPQFLNGSAPQKTIDHLKSSKLMTKPKLFKVIYPYKPRQIDELELKLGDILTVTMQCDDGWFVGQSTVSGQYGTFPGNYVQEI